MQAARDAFAPPGPLESCFRFMGISQGVMDRREEAWRTNGCAGSAGGMQQSTATARPPHPRRVRSKYRLWREGQRVRGMGGSGNRAQEKQKNRWYKRAASTPARPRRAVPAAAGWAAAAACCRRRGAGRPERQRRPACAGARRRQRPCERAWRAGRGSPCAPTAPRRCWRLRPGLRGGGEGCGVPLRQDGLVRHKVQCSTSVGI